MQAKSRTSNSIRNAKFALLFYCFNLVLQFFSRKIFLDYLGAEVLGLNTTAQNLLGFLNLAELGIGAAVSYNLYRPLFDEDRQAINDIVSIQGWLYRRIAIIVTIGACVLMCFFPLIFAKAEVPVWYIYGTFLALLVSALLGYFVNYRQIVLSADQKEYKITCCVQGSKIIKIFLQMLAISLLSNGYVWWMILEIVFAVVTSIVLDITIKNEYPWLCPKICLGKELQYRYPAIISKTKQVFFHKIGGFVLSQTSPLVIYAYASLTLVAIYGNYMLIVSGLIALMNALLNGINAGVGNLIAEGDAMKIKSVFWKISTLRMWMASVVCFGMYMLGDAFIILWVGEEYIMPHFAFIILIIITFIQLTRTYEVFLAAYGLFKDIWAPLIEATINLGMSILLGRYFGLTGILSGVLISLLVIICGWKPYFLYREGFKESVIEYVLLSLKKLCLLLFSFVASVWIISHYISNSVFYGYGKWAMYGVFIVLFYMLISLSVLLFFDRDMRNNIRQIFKMIYKR